MNRLRSVVKSRRIHLKYFFTDFDTLNRGTVTANQFRRGLKTALDISGEDADVLVKRYEVSPKGFVNYLCLHADVDYATAEEDRKSAAPLSPLKSPEVAAVSSSLGAAEVESLEEHLRTEMIRQRIRAEEFFRDFDKLKKSVMTCEQFKACLGAIRIPRLLLGPLDLEALCDRYAVEDNGVRMVCWRDFCDRMSEMPSKSGVAGGSLSPAHARKDVGTDEHELMEAIQAVAHRVRLRQLLLKPAFQDFDRASTGLFQTQRVTMERYRRALTSMGFSLTPRQLEVIGKRYEEEGMFNYVLFDEDVQKLCGSV